MDIETCMIMESVGMDSLNEGIGDGISKMYTGKSEGELADFEQRYESMRTNSEKTRLTQDIEQSILRARRFYENRENFGDGFKRAMTSGLLGGILGIVIGEVYSSTKMTSGRARSLLKQHMVDLEKLQKKVKAKKVD